MVQKSHFKNEWVEAYLEGKLDEIPAEALETVKDIASRRTQPPKPETPKSKSVRLVDHEGQ